ncbi:hypothetical protein ACMHYB_21240 [Sorangium sp. So ce1128]
MSPRSHGSAAPLPPNKEHPTGAQTLAAVAESALEREVREVKRLLTASKPKKTKKRASPRPTR